MAYSETVLSMYPYIAEYDSDGYDDIKEGEEDDFVRWDPVNKTHVARETPLSSASQDEVETKPETAQNDNVVAQSLVRDKVGLEVLIEAAKVISEDRHDKQDALGFGNVPGSFWQYYDPTDDGVAPSSSSV